MVDCRIPVVLLAIGLAGCATPGADLGLSVQNNVVAQVVDLEPVYAGVPIEGANAQRVTDATRRYNTGTVKSPSALKAPAK